MNRTVEGLDAPMVGSDNAGGVASVLEWLQKRGHHDVAFIGGPSSISTGAERLAAYKSGREAHGISTDDGLIDTGDFLAGGASDAMLRILDRGTHPTAVFGANGPTTMGAIRALRERLGADWAKQIDVVSFDDLDWFAFASPAISAVRNDATTIGRLGVLSLVELIEGRPTESVRVQTEFIDRSRT
jgi:LacI family transcriptional regulator